MEPWITLGVTAYNLENYIGPCLESILAQADGAAEILIVDDGSADRTPAICSAYAERDPRIRFHRKENGGVSTARNWIIDHARGTWISFIDGDDRIAPGALALFKEYAGQAPAADFIKFDMIFYRFDQSVPKYTVDAPDLSVEGDMRTELIRYTVYPAAGEQDFINKTLRSMCGTLWRRSFLSAKGLYNDPQLLVSQDVFFNLQAVAAAERVLLVRKPAYLYRFNEQSTVRGYHARMIERCTVFVGKLRAFVEARQDPALWERYLLRCISDFNYCLKLTVCHRDNPGSREERSRAFDALTRTGWCREAVERCAAERLTQNDAAMFRALQSGGFRAVDRYFRKKDRANRVKRLLSKLGLNKLLGPAVKMIKRGKR